MATIMEQLANVEPEDRLRAMLRNIRMEYEKRGLPYRGSFELTPHCTLDCKMCYVHRADGKYPHRVLTGDEWINIMDQAIDMGMVRATLTGGECMLHPDFKRIYAHLKRKGVYVSLKTNGTLLDDAMLDFLSEYPPINVQVSVYGSSPEVYERVTGRADAFYKVDAALRKLSKRKMPHGVTLTISKYNLSDYENIYKYVTRITDCNVGVDADLFEPVEGGQYAAKTFELSPEEYLDVYQKIFEWEYGYSAELHLDKVLDFASNCFEKVPRYPQAMPCTAGIIGFFVSYYGTMLPCIDFPLARSDLQKESFKTAWETINRAAKAYRRSEECANCALLGHCCFCPARYSSETNGKNGMHGVVPCDKSKHIVISLLKKTMSINKNIMEEESSESVPETAGDCCESGFC